jgi:DNA-directed RNA polymerase subunit RPC12/RpoP
MTMTWQNSGFELPARVGDLTFISRASKTHAIYKCERCGKIVKRSIAGIMQSHVKKYASACKECFAKSRKKPTYFTRKAPADA